jgi:hypothetical protein
LESRRICSWIFGKVWDVRNRYLAEVAGDDWELETLLLTVGLELSASLPDASEESPSSLESS